MKRAFWALLAIAGMSLTTAALGQGFPTKPVRLIVPYPAGGTVDGVVRNLQPELAKAFGQPVVVENKVGAAGRIGTAEGARAEPDGYTVVMIYDNYPIDPIVYKDLPYDPWKDLLPISLVVRAPLVAVASNTLPANDIRELVQYAKANPGKVDFGSTGVGSSSHLAAELFMQATSTKMTHIPYKGGAPAQTDLLAGNLHLFWGTTFFGKTLAQSGKVKLLGQAGKQRSPSIPDVKTLAEQGFDSIEVYGWMGLMAPKGTPPEIIARWRSELVKAANVPAVKGKLNDQGFDVVTSTADEFRAFLMNEHRKWAQLIVAAKISLQQ
jgi:tripartite-type tricarboxylate transporter receptor subunit TctC